MRWYFAKVVTNIRCLSSRVRTLAASLHSHQLPAITPASRWSCGRHMGIACQTAGGNAERKVKDVVFRISFSCSAGLGSHHLPGETTHSLVIMGLRLTGG